MSAQATRANGRFEPFSLPGGRVLPDPELRPHTGSWRSEMRPEVDLGACVNCLLCWAYCPDRAIEVSGAVMTGIDYDLCKACEICVAVCPTQAIRMVPESAEPAKAKTGGDGDGARGTD